MLGLGKGCWRQRGYCITLEFSEFMYIFGIEIFVCEISTKY